ncbi:hypothetical protein [Streptomyces sp. YIM S03343]
MSRTAALAALIAYNDANDPTADIDSRITDLIADLAELGGDPEAVIEAAREKTAGRRPFYRVAASERLATALDLMKHYLGENDRLSKAANYASGAVVRAIRVGREDSRERNAAKWEALVAERRAASRRLTAVCGAVDNANADWFASRGGGDETGA